MCHFQGLGLLFEIGPQCCLSIPVPDRPSAARRMEVLNMFENVTEKEDDVTTVDAATVLSPASLTLSPVSVLSPNEY